MSYDDEYEAEVEAGRAKALSLLGEAREIMRQLIPLTLKYPVLQNDPVLVQFLDEWQIEIRQTAGKDAIE